MEKNFFLLLSNLTGQEQTKFAQWLYEYEMHLELEAFWEENSELLSIENVTEDIVELKKLIRKDITEPALGQIRCIKKDMTTYHQQISFLLVLSKWNDQYWLVAPFSPYSTPATTGEISTGIDFHAYKVVQAWNAFVVPDILLLTKTSFFRKIDDKVCKDAKALFFQKLENTELPDELKDRIGPRINSEIDPRIQYIYAEQAQIKPLQTAIAQAMDFWDELPEADLLDMKQANDEEPPSMSFAISGHAETIKISDIGNGNLDVQVFTAENSLCRNKFNMWYILNDNGFVLGNIIKGRCRISKADLENAVCLADYDGNLIALSPIE